MPTELVSLQRCLDRVGVEHDTDDAARILKLLRAVSAEVMDRAHRTFSATPVIHDDVVDAAGLGSLILPHVPVTDILSVNTVYTDGTNEVLSAPSRAEWDGVTSWGHSLAGTVFVGDMMATLDDVTGVEVGQHMLIADDEVVRITAVADPDVTFEPAARFTNAAGGVQHVSGSTSWLLEDAGRGKLVVSRGRRRLRVIYRVDEGGVPVELAEAVLAWVASRWNDRDVSAGSTGYTTGDDSETKDAEYVGQPPPDAARTLARYWRRVRNGVV